jgi:signal transduction histidine kinase/CheY-like chemotaxis protein
MESVHIVDLTIAVAYFSIPTQLIYFLIQYVRSGKNVSRGFIQITVLFAFFTCLCGCGHFLEHTKNVSALYIVKVSTAIVSWITAVGALFILPKIIALPGRANELELEVVQQSKEVTQATQAVNVALQARQEIAQFMAFICHEIRNPLQVVAASSECLQKSSLSTDQRENVSILIQSANIMATIVNDVLDLSRLEAGKLQIDHVAVDLNQLLHQLVVSFQNSARLRHLDLGLNIASDVPAAIMSDSTRINQILINLIGNALKFTSSGSITVTATMASPTHRRKPSSTDMSATFGASSKPLKLTSSTSNSAVASSVSSIVPLHVVVSRDDAPGRMLELRVEDTGCGIPDDVLPKLFRPFSQAHGSIARKQGGSGLGLCIVAELVHLMNGELSVASIERKGSCFIVRLPADEVPQHILSAQTALQTVNGPVPSPVASLSTLPSFDPLNISPLPSRTVALVVDDQAPNCKMLKKMLDTCGFESDIASDGREALVLCSNNAYAFILMDINMPVMNGIEATRVLRSRNDFTPVVALTGSCRSEDKDEALAAGVNAYITKPIKRSDLSNLIKRFVSGHPSKSNNINDNNNNTNNNNNNNNNDSNSNSNSSNNGNNGNSGNLMNGRRTPPGGRNTPPRSGSADLRSLSSMPPSATAARSMNDFDHSLPQPSSRDHWESKLPPTSTSSFLSFPASAKLASGLINPPRPRADISEKSSDSPRAESPSSKYKIVSQDPNRASDAPPPPSPAHDPISLFAPLSPVANPRSDSDHIALAISGWPQPERT